MGCVLGEVLKTVTGYSKAAFRFMDSYHDKHPGYKNKTRTPRRENWTGISPEITGTTIQNGMIQTIVTRPQSVHIENYLNI